MPNSDEIITSEKELLTIPFILDRYTAVGETITEGLLHLLSSMAAVTDAMKMMFDAAVEQGLMDERGQLTEKGLILVNSQTETEEEAPEEEAPEEEAPKEVVFEEITHPDDRNPEVQALAYPLYQVYMASTLTFEEFRPHIAELKRLLREYERFAKETQHGVNGWVAYALNKTGLDTAGKT